MLSAVVTKSLVIVFPRKAQKARNGDREWRFVVASISRRLVITQHSLRRSSSPSLQRGKAVFQRSAPGEAREKRLPLAEIRGKGNPEPRKTQKCTKSCSGASLIGGNARSSPPPRPFQLLGVLGELGVGRFHAKGAKPAKGSLGRSPFLQKGIDSGGAKEHNPDLL